MVAADAKENGELVPPMKMDTFTFQLATWRRDVDRELEVSIDVNENNLIQVINVSEIGLAGEESRRIPAIPELCSQDLRPGDIIEVVNGEIQRELGVLSTSTRRLFAKSDLDTVTVESDRSDVQTAIKVQKFDSVEDLNARV